MHCKGLVDLGREHREDGTTKHYTYVYVVGVDVVTLPRFSRELFEDHTTVVVCGKENPTINIYCHTFGQLMESNRVFFKFNLFVYNATQNLS